MRKSASKAKSLSFWGLGPNSSGRWHVVGRTGNKEICTNPYIKASGHKLSQMSVRTPNGGGVWRGPPPLIRLAFFRSRSNKNRIFFFIQFWYRFLELFASKMTSKMEPKSIKNAFQNPFRFLNRFFMDFDLQKHAPDLAKVWFSYRFL